MPNRDYLPTSEADLYLWAQNFNSVFQVNATSLGFSVGEATAMQDQYDLFSDALSAHTAAVAAARSAKEDKDDQKGALVELVRNYVRRIQVNPNTTDPLRGQLGINVPSGSKATIPVPTDLPLVLLDWSVRGQVTLHVAPTPSNERINTFPEGCHSVLIEYHTANTDWQFVAITTTSPYLHPLGNANNEEVTYRCAYLNPRGEQGPWSDEASAWVIAA